MKFESRYCQFDGIFPSILGSIWLHYLPSLHNSRLLSHGRQNRLFHCSKRGVNSNKRIQIARMCWIGSPKKSINVWYGRTVAPLSLVVDYPRDVVCAAANRHLGVFRRRRRRPRFTFTDTRDVDCVSAGHRERVRENECVWERESSCPHSKRVLSDEILGLRVVFSG